MASRNQLDQLVSVFASGNKSEFARRLGITKQSLNTWYNHEFLDIEKVFFACPGVSAEWLITGDGEMLTEKRSPVSLSDDLLIPFIHQEGLLAGKWDESESFILARKCKDQFVDCDFIARIPNGDLSYYIYPKSLLGCVKVGVDELKKESLYIVQTKHQGPFFVQFVGEDEYDGKKLKKFTTRRGNDNPDIQLALPPSDIVQCAYIDGYSVNPWIEFFCNEYPPLPCYDH